MSHTTSIEDVVFVDINALKTALGELNRNGVKASLVENVAPRAYFPNQEGLGVAPYVIKIEDCPFDIGLYPAKDAKGYVPRCDLWAGHIAAKFGVQVKQGQSYERAALGKLYQMYAVHAATRQATKQGYTVRRTVQPNGSITLTLTGND